MKPMLRLAYVTAVPGTQYFFLEGQNQYLRENSFELHAISSPGPRLTKLAERDRAQPHAVPISRNLAIFADLKALLRLIAVIRGIRPHILHVSTPKAGLLGALAGWICRVPVRVFLMRGSATEAARGPRRKIYRLLEALTARLCHEVICVSPSLLDWLHNAKVLPSDRGIVLHNGGSNGIDPGRFNPARYPDPPSLPSVPDEARCVGYVGRMVRDKGIDELAQAWVRLRSQFPDIHLLLLGSWEEENSASPVTRACLEDDPNVHIFGRVEDVVPYLARMSVFLFPTHGSEGLPNALLEAGAMEVPCVASAVVGCVDVVEDGATGTLVPSRSPEDLVSATAHYLQDDCLSRKHGRAARRRIRSLYRREDLWEAYVQEYCRLVHNAGILPSRLK